MVSLTIIGNVFAQDAIDGVQREVLRSNKIKELEQLQNDFSPDTEAPSLVQSFAKKEEAKVEKEDDQVQAIIQLVNKLNTDEGFLESKIAANYNFRADDLVKDKYGSGSITITTTDDSKSYDPGVNIKRILSIDQGSINLDGSLSILLGDKPNTKTDAPTGLFLSAGVNAGVYKFYGIRKESKLNDSGTPILTLDSISTSIVSLTPRVQLQFIATPEISIGISANACFARNYPDSLFNPIFGASFNPTPSVLSYGEININYSTPKIRGEIDWILPFKKYDEMPGLKEFFRIKLRLSEPIKL